MTNREFDNYLTLVSRLLRLKRGQVDQIAGELRDHLELRVAELTEEGVDTEEATRMALEEFGEAASLAGQFQFISETYRQRWMMRFATLGTAALFLTAILVMAMWPTESRFGSPDSSIASESSFATSASTGKYVSADEVEMSDLTRRTTVARKILRQEIELDFEGVEFHEVMDFLSDKCEIPFILDMTARDDSLAEDEPINFQIGGIPLNKALRMMLIDHNATFMIQDGVVRIISLDVASDPEYFVRRIFDVSDLLARINNLESRRILLRNASAARSGGFGGGGNSPPSFESTKPQAGSGDGAGSTITSIESSGRKVATLGLAGGRSGALDVADGGADRKTAECLLTEAIKHNIAMDSWAETNGDGTMTTLGGLLIVVQSEQINESVEEMLQDLAYLFAKRESAK